MVSAVDNFSTIQEERCHHWNSRETASGGPDFLITGGVHMQGGPTLARVMRKILGIRRGSPIKDPGSYSSSELLLFGEMESHLSGVCVFVWVSVLGSHVTAVSPRGAVSAAWLVRKKHSTASSGCGGLGITRGDKAELSSQRLVMENPAKVGSRTVIV